MPRWRSLFFDEVPAKPECDGSFGDIISGHKKVSQTIRKMENDTSKFTSELIQSSKDALDLLDHASQRIAKDEETLS